MPTEWDCEGMGELPGVPETGGCQGAALIEVGVLGHVSDVGAPERLNEGVGGKTCDVGEGGRWLRFVLEGEGGVEEEVEVRGGVGGRWSTAKGIIGACGWCAGRRLFSGTAGPTLLMTVVGEETTCREGGCSGVGGRELGRWFTPAGTSGVGPKGRWLEVVGR